MLKIQNICGRTLNSYIDTFPAEVKVLEHINLNENAASEISDGLEGAALYPVVFNVCSIKKEVNIVSTEPVT